MLGNNSSGDVRQDGLANPWISSTPKHWGSLLQPASEPPTIKKPLASARQPSRTNSAMLVRILTSREPFKNLLVFGFCMWCTDESSLLSQGQECLP